MPKKQGGKREGSGRKPIRGHRKIVTTIGLSPEVKLYLDSGEESNAEICEKLIRKSAGFRRWIFSKKQRG